MQLNPIFVSKRGGSISILNGESEWIFLVCFKHLHLYTNDFTAAKLQLEKLEMLTHKSGKISLTAMKKKGESLRLLVEKAAAPYVHEEAASHLIM